MRTVAGFVLRWNPLVLAAKAMLAEGLFGEPIFVQTDYWHNGEVSGYPGAKGRLRRATIDAMLGGGCHAVDLARYLMGSDVVEVTALETTALEGLAAPANQVALVRFANGKAGKVSACTEPWIPYQFNIDLLGTRRRSARQPLLQPKAARAAGLDDVPDGPAEQRPGRAPPVPGRGRPLRGVHPRRGWSPTPACATRSTRHEACFAISQSAQNGGRRLQ